MLDEGALHRMRFAVDADAFDRRHLVAFTRDCKCQAGQNTPPVHPDGARTAGSLVATFLRARQLEVLAECIEQAGARLEVEQTLGSIYAKREMSTRRPALNLRGGESLAVDAHLGCH
jgi:hypothetical protein